jgi:hypothetical protein
VCAYDQGFTTTTVTGTFLGIPPSETTSIVKVDINGKVKTDVNTAVVTPRAPAAGYISPDTINVTRSGPATGKVAVSLLDPDSLRNAHTYRIEFEDSTAFHNNPNPYYRMLDVTAADTLIRLTQLKGPQEVTPAVDGFSASMTNDQTVAIDQQNTKWKTGSSNYVVQVGFDSRFAPAYQIRRVNYPADFEITFVPQGQGDMSFPQDNFSQPIQSNITVRNVTENTDHVQFIFRDENGNSLFDAGDAVFIVYGDSAGKRATTFPAARKAWSITLVKDTTIAESQQRLPQPGDVYKVSTRRPFRTGEYYSFTVRGPGFDLQKAQTGLKDVAVVPNPYVGAASWEPASTSVGRGERRIFFIHLPKKCTIRIYTISGHLVQTLEHNSTLDNGQEPWNLVTKDGMDVAYGVYVFHVEAEGVGSKIDRFAIIK